MVVGRAVGAGEGSMVGSEFGLGTGVRAEECRMLGLDEGSVVVVGTAVSLGDDEGAGESFDGVGVGSTSGTALGAVGAGVGVVVGLRVG